MNLRIPYRGLVVGAVAFGLGTMWQARRRRGAAITELTEKLARFQAAQEATRAELASMPKSTRKLMREWSQVVYTEVEDLMALYRDIGPEQALPRMHGWAAGPDLARFLYLEVVERGRSAVLECGSGSTTVILAYACRAVGKGRVFALEHNPRFASATRKMLEERGLSEWAEVVDAPLTEVSVGGGTQLWYDPAVIPDQSFDLVLVDGPPGSVGPQARYPAVPLLVDRLTEDAMVVLDDARRTDERDIGERWAAEHDGFGLEWFTHDHGTLVLRNNADDEPDPDPRAV
ncbi:class I SAM-dependent methyltransferase [Glycomyces buryatensis]|uniref:Class I SAM-dependent methyltransferase n=1 Tax=Glycomyces buryatensis TaxID=2570927 RepID=A0A4S8Q3P0_9ACTN|nr:class I SAM-dependent methyltransferase [Glycomyces buryatensis]THV38640.1 class I SAM-dependent methyltransferase [Glycomyces buryatensis]